MPSSVLTPAGPAELTEPSFLVGGLLGLVLGAALAFPVWVLLLKL